MFFINSGCMLLKTTYPFTALCSQHRKNTPRLA